LTRKRRLEPFAGAGQPCWFHRNASGASPPPPPRINPCRFSLPRGNFGVLWREAHWYGWSCEDVCFRGSGSAHRWGRDSWLAACEAASRGVSHGAYRRRNSVSFPPPPLCHASASVCDLEIPASGPADAMDLGQCSHRRKHLAGADEGGSDWLCCLRAGARRVTTLCAPTGLRRAPRRRRLSRLVSAPAPFPVVDGAITKCIVALLVDTGTVICPQGKRRRGSRRRIAYQVKPLRAEKERIFIDLMTSDRKLKASREGWK